MNFKKKPILGMLHLYGREQALDYADKEIEIFEQEGVDGLIIENYHGGMDEVRQALKIMDEVDDKMLKGINILPNDFEMAYALAAAYELDFIQLDYIAGKYGHNPKKPTELNYHHYMKFRNKFPDITILGGVWPKGYTPIEGSDLLEDIDEAHHRCDAVVVTGSGTGVETPLDKIKKFRNSTNVFNNFPLIIGAGLTPENVAEQLEFADGAIVGSCFKKHGTTSNPINRELVKEFMIEVNKHRATLL